MGYLRVVHRDKRVAVVRKNGFSGSLKRAVRIPAFTAGNVTPAQVQEWITIGAAHHHRHTQSVARKAVRQKEIIRARIMRLWKATRRELAGKKTPEDYRETYNRFSADVKGEFGKEAGPILRELVEKGIVLSRAPQGQFHTGHFKSQEDAIAFIQKNRGAAIKFLMRKYSIRTTSAANALVDEVLPVLVEGLMRYNPAKGASPLTYMHWWLRAGMRQKLALHRKRTLSLDVERSRDDRKPFRLIEEIAAPRVFSETSPEMTAERLAIVMNRLDNRSTLIFALHLMNYSTAQIAAVLPSPHPSKNGKPIGTSAVRMALGKIARIVKSELEKR